MQPTLHIELIEQPEAIAQLRDAWNLLAANNATSTVFQTFEWFDAWWRAFGANRRLVLLSLASAGELQGIAPLMLTRGPMGLRQIEFTGSPNADYQDLILSRDKPEAARLVCEYLHSTRSQWDMVVLRNLPEESQNYQSLLREFPRLGLGIMDVEPQPCPTLLMQGKHPDPQSLLEKYSVRRATRGLERLGETRFEVMESAALIEQNLPCFFDQHVQRRADLPDPSPFLDPNFRAWYWRLAGTAHAAGWLHFSRLDCGPRPAAFHFGFRYGNRLTWYKPSFNPDLAAQSPGIGLIKHLVADATAGRLDELDFGAGQEPFKDRFSNHRRTVRNLRVFSSYALHRAFMAGHYLRNTAKVARRRWRVFRQDS